MGGMIRIDGLTKSFGDSEAVSSLCLSIEKGESVGLLGPNGAGKTTTISMLVGALSPDKGEIEIDGKSDPRLPAVRRVIGLAPQSLALYDKLSAEENLAFFGGIYGLKGEHLKERIEWCLEFAALTDRRGDRVETYSGGMKRRLNLATALVHEPSILLLDEPTVGVDPQSRNHIFESIAELGRKGLTLIYTTHYMEEAERLCDRVAIMDKGKILTSDSVDALIGEHGGASWLHAEFAEPPGDSIRSLMPGIEVEGSKIRFQTDDPLAAMELLRNADGELRTFHLNRPDLESVFLNLTGRTLRDS